MVPSSYAILSRIPRNSCGLRGTINLIMSKDILARYVICDISSLPKHFVYITTIVNKQNKIDRYIETANRQNFFSPVSQFCNF